MMVARKHLNIALYPHCLYCSFSHSNQLELPTLNHPTRISDGDVVFLVTETEFISAIATAVGLEMLA
jgi:hypothetical protein